MGVGHTKEARSTNFVFTMGFDRELSFAAQSSNVADITLGETAYYTGVKDLKLPSNKITNSPLVVDFLLSEDLREWIEIYKWLLTAKNSTDPMEGMLPCSIIIVDSHNQPVVTFDYTDAFPMELSGIQYALNTDDSPVLTFTGTFLFNRFKVTTKDGLVIDEKFKY